MSKRIQNPQHMVVRYTRHAVNSLLYKQHSLTLSLFIVGLGLFFFGVSFIAPSPVPGENTMLLKNAERDPFALKSHLDLARFYFQKRQTAPAFIEINLVRQSQNRSSPAGSSVLGTSNQTDSLLEMIRNQKKTEEEQVAHWSTITEQSPGYRDGWIQLAYAHYNTRDQKKLFTSLEQAKIHHPAIENQLPIEILAYARGKKD